MSDSRLARFKQVLTAALRTEYYRPRLKDAALETAAQIDSINSIAEALRRLPPLDPAVFLKQPERFRNPGARGPKPAAFWMPHCRVPRTAVLTNGFRRSRKVRVFPNGLTPGLESFGAEALAGPLEKLLELGSAVEAGRLSLPPLTHAVIAFTRTDGPRLRDDDRELLWRMFEVPAFEQILSPSGCLVAWECEAHQGLHVSRESAFFEAVETPQGPELLFTSLSELALPVLRLATGVPGIVDSGLCGCGEEAERLYCGSTLRDVRAAAAG